MSLCFLRTQGSSYLDFSLNRVRTPERIVNKCFQSNQNNGVTSRGHSQRRELLTAGRNFHPSLRVRRPTVASHLPPPSRLNPLSRAPRGGATALPGDRPPWRRGTGR